MILVDCDHFFISNQSFA